MGRAHHAARPVRITTAATSRADDISHRQRRYLISMGIRTACFLAAVAVGEGWLRWAFFAGAVFLPYVAVVMANAGEQRDDGFALLPGDGLPSLPSGPEPKDADETGADDESRHESNL
jgi:hypothetical protein